MSRLPMQVPAAIAVSLLPVLMFGLTTRLRFLCALLAGMLWCWLTLHSELALRVTANETLEPVDLKIEVIGLPTTDELITRFSGRVLADQGVHTGRHLKFSWYSATQPVIAGQRWRLQARLRAPTGSVNPGGFDYERWLFTQRIHGSAYVIPGSVRVIGSRWASIDRFRDLLRQRLIGVTTAADLPTFLALSLGDTSQLTHAHWAILNATGATHLLIVSGLHVGLVASLIFFAGRRCGLSNGLTAAVTVAAAALYSLLSGWGLPVQRALVMTVVMVVGSSIARYTSLFDRLCLAAAFVVFLDPLATLTRGFWLSFGAVAALLVGLSGLREQQGLLTKGWQLLRSQWIVFAGLLPLLALMTGQLPTGALLVNLIAIPVVALLLVPLVLFGLLVIVTPLGELAFSLAGFLAALLWQGLHWMAEADLHLQLSEVPLLAAGIAAVGVLLLVLPVRLMPGWSALLLTLPLLARPSLLASDELRITFLDVGQGLSVVLETREQVVLYDTGPRFGESFSAARQIVLPFIYRRGWRALDTFMISHRDNDHAGGLEDILTSVRVDRVQAGTNCDANWQSGDVYFQALNPGRVRGAGNDASCLLLVEVGGYRILLTGDIEAAGEYRLLQRLREPVDLMLVPHHGSLTSSTPALLNTLRPKIAVVTTGYQNRFGHPAAAVLARYEARGSNVLNTADTGAIEFLISGQGVEISFARDAFAGVWRRNDVDQHSNGHY